MGSPFRPAVSALLQELRNEMKRRGVHVRQIAEQMGVAEPTLWRWLRGKGLTLDALDRMCALLDLDLRDLLANADTGGAGQFTYAQERVLAADRGLALVFFAILNGAQRDVFEEEFRLSTTRVTAYIERLHRLSLIDIAPNGRVRPKTARNVKWRPGGPLAVAFDRTVKHFFLAMDFGAADARYISDMVHLSNAGREHVQVLFDKLLQDIHLISERERTARFTPREWNALFLLIRPLNLDDVSAEWQDL